MKNPKALHLFQKCDTYDVNDVVCRRYKEHTEEKHLGQVYFLEKTIVELNLKK